MPLTVLVVEDEDSNMKILSLGLMALGHRVLQADNPVEGIAFAQSLQPDVILMDLMFMGAPFDGIEAIRRIKADPRTAHIPIVAQTAAVLDFAQRAVEDAGATGFLRKPFRRAQLAAALEAATAEPCTTTWSTYPVPMRTDAPLTTFIDSAVSACIDHRTSITD